jgi:hypothetical protein
MFDQIRAKTAALNEQIAALQKEAAGQIKPLLQEFITAHPQVKQVAWTQYTPYFNDGESCVFSVHGFGFYFEGDNLEDHLYEHELYRYENFDKKEVCSPETHAACLTLEKDLNSVQDALKALFGDHVTVIVNADGVSVDEYDHD